VAQFARPSADTFVSDWEEDDGTTDALYAEVDESVAADGDYIRTIERPDNAVFVFALSSVTAPGAGTQTVRYRYRKSAAGGEEIGLTIQLREGYTNEGSPGTLIDENTHGNISGAGWVDGSFTVSGIGDS
jgi:hypothetical protein